MRIKTKTLIPLLSTIVGGFWVVYGLTQPNHGFWHAVRGPLAGFVPTLVAATLTVVSIIGVIRSFKDKDVSSPMESWTIVMAAAIVFSLVFIFGMIFSLMAFVVIWLRFYEKESWKNTIIVLVIAFFIVYGAFVSWLGIHFPPGLILETILG